MLTRDMCLEFPVLCYHISKHVQVIGIDFRIDGIFLNVKL